MNYSELNVPEQIHKAVERMGFTEMTEVQEKAIPPMMEGKDIIAKAPTGTGKTCAFGIPLILGLDQSRNYPQAVVMAPTRELAQQITEDLQDLAHFYPDIRVVTVYGGANIQKQIEKLKKGAQIVVATPGRLQDHMNRRTVDLSHVTTVVLDEADEMLNMGFYKDVRKILDQIKSRQRLAMFSATISREVMDIGWLYQRDAEEITVQPVEDSAPRIDQYLVLTTGRNKLADMAEIIVQKGYKRVMVFCNQKYTTAMLANQMARLNFVVDCLHGDLSPGGTQQNYGRIQSGQYRCAGGDRRGRPRHRRVRGGRRVQPRCAGLQRILHAPHRPHRAREAYGRGLCAVHEGRAQARARHAALHPQHRHTHCFR